MKLIMKRIYIVSLFILIVLTVTDVNVYAKKARNVDSHPSLEVYELNGSVKAEWAVDILDSDVLYQTGFEENDVLPEFYYGSSIKDLPENRRYGGQSFTTEDSFSGNRAVKVVDSYANGNVYSVDLNGDWYMVNDSSWLHLDKSRYYIANNTDLSLSLRMKTTGKGKVSVSGVGGAADYGIPTGVKFVEDVKVGDRVVKVDSVKPFLSSFESGKKYHLARNKGRYTYSYITNIDEENSTLTLSLAFTGEFKAGDDVLKHVHVNPVRFGGREATSNSGWNLFNLNTKISDLEYYDTLKRGFYISVSTITGDVVYIDDLKVGYATETELYRDNINVYTGKLSDYQDSGATDKAKPEMVNDYKVNEKAGKQYLKIEKPKDNGTTYKYKVKAISNDKTGEYWSEVKNVNVKSGVKGYSYVIDKNKETTPNGKVNSTSGEIELASEVYKEHYLHIQTIDNAGNKSAVNHIKLDKVRDIIPPKVSLSISPSELTNKDVTINIDASDSQSGIKKVMYVGEDMVFNGDFAKNLEGWQEFSGITTPKKGYITFEDKEASGGRTRLRQLEMFKESVAGATYYSEITARGNGVLNTRFSFESAETGGSFVDKYAKVINSNNFETHNFLMDRKDFSTNHLVVEKVGGGSLDIQDVKVFAQKEITDGKLKVKENGLYKIVVEDNEGNISTKSIEITNIDKTAPTVSVVQDIKDETHKNIILSVNAEDPESGIKSVTYIGENVIMNGDFKEGLKYWDEDKPIPELIGGGDISLRDGHLYLADNRVAVNKAEQRGVFVDTAIGTKFYSEVVARGSGVLNARYAKVSGPHQTNYAQDLKSESKFNNYKFEIERGDNARDVFMVERRTKSGWIEISDVKVFAQKDITDTRSLEVTRNGKYTFVVEDNAGNITKITHEVDNIRRDLQLTPSVIEDDFDITIGEEEGREIDIGNLKITDWRDTVANNWVVSLSATRLASDSFQYPSGTIHFKGVDRVERIDGANASNFESSGGALDDGAIQILKAASQRGVYEVSFKKNALEVNIPDSAARQGSYRTSLKWQLEAVPEVE